MKNWGPRLAFSWLLFWFVAAFLSPLFLYDKAVVAHVRDAFSAPSLAHIFGTDHLGRDILLRVLTGSAVSLGVGSSAVLMALVLGTWLGAVAGYHGGKREKILLAVVDLFLCFPAFFLILSVVAFCGAGIWNLIWVLAATSWMGVARLVRAEVLTIKEREFVMAARSFGMSPMRILWKHLIPNAMAPIRVSAVLGLSSAILVEAGLSFLGLGVQPPVPSWGNLLMDGKMALGAAWWITFFPGAIIFITVLSLNVLSESLAKPRRSHA